MRLVVLNDLPMRVLLRNTKTLRYCTGSRGWATAAGQALEFPSIPEAVRFALDEKLPGIEVVVEYNFLPEVVVPLQPEWCDFDSPGCDAVGARLAQSAKLEDARSVRQ